MTVTPEELAAYADGELTGELAERVANAVAADPALRKQIEAHRALRRALAAHFAPILDQPVPPRLAEAAGSLDAAEGSGLAPVIDLGEARQRRDQRSLPRWHWAGGAMAASLMLAVGLITLARVWEPREGYADPRLARLLDETLVASQSPSAANKVLLSFQNGTQELCRAYLTSAGSGIACRDADGWRIELEEDGGEAQATEYRMATSRSAILEAAQQMAVSPALSAEQEKAARESEWRP